MIMEKKLQQFLDICMEDARAQSNDTFQEYSQALQLDLENIRQMPGGRPICRSGEKKKKSGES